MYLIEHTSDPNALAKAMLDSIREIDFVHRAEAAV